MIKKLFSYSYGDFNIYIKRLLNFFPFLMDILNTY